MRGKTVTRSEMFALQMVQAVLRHPDAFGSSGLLIQAVCESKKKTPDQRSLVFPRVSVKGLILVPRETWDAVLQFTATCGPGTMSGFGGLRLKEAEIDFRAYGSAGSLVASVVGRALTLKNKDGWIIHITT